LLLIPARLPLRNPVTPTRIGEGPVSTPSEDPDGYPERQVWGHGLPSPSTEPGQVNLFFAKGINDRGSIIVDGKHQSGPKLDQYDVFLLTPVEKIANR
jgi:hypothetical protein